MIVGEPRNPGTRRKIKPFWIPRQKPRGMTNYTTVFDGKGISSVEKKPEFGGKVGQGLRHFEIAV